MATLRACMDCGKPIAFCNGFTLASDLLEALAGKLDVVRERCALCVFLLEAPDLLRAGIIKRHPTEGAHPMTDEIRREPTQWAEMKPDVYGGPKCDQVIPRWECHADGDMDSDTEKVLTLSARTFPPGTKIVISEPRCPKCDELREPKYPTPKSGPLYEGPCRCGFDWDAWVLDQYS